MKERNKKRETANLTDWGIFLTKRVSCIPFLKKWRVLGEESTFTSTIISSPSLNVEGVPLLFPWE
jgi:hypothetical protein